MTYANRIIYRLLSVVMFSCSLALGCASNQKDFGELRNAEEGEKLYISFEVPDADYRRTLSLINRTVIGWVESGTWIASSDSGGARVKIYVASLYDGRAFKKDTVIDMRSVARNFTSSTNLDFGEQGVIKTTSGDIDYLFFRQNSLPCMLIRKYWSDPELQSDLIQLTVTFEWVAGSSVIYAVSCQSGSRDLEPGDLNLLFNNMTVENLYWPSDMFGPVGGAFAQ